MVPTGARISAGKSGKVAMALGTMTLVSVNRSPTTCMPSPESPAKRMTTDFISRSPRAASTMGLWVKRD